jgi:hypothetical protein
MHPTTCPLSGPNRGRWWLFALKYTTMTIQELRVKKATLEGLILGLVFDFQEQNNVKVQSIKVKHIEATAKCGVADITIIEINTDL